VSGDSRRTARLIRRLGWLLFALVLLVGAAWLVGTGLLAKRQVDAAQHNVEQLKASVDAGDIEQASRQAQLLAGHAHRAHRLTTGPSWWLAAQLPWLGRPAVAVRGDANQLDELSAHVLTPLVGVAGQLTAGTLFDNGTVQLPPLMRSIPVIGTARQHLAITSAQVHALPTNTWLGPVNRGTAKFQTQVGTLTNQLESVQRATTLLPQLLGADRPQRYFVGLENEAESRGLGGIPGAFVILTTDRGKIRFERFESDTALDKVRTNLHLGSEYSQRYGSADPANTYANSTISPDFTDAARIWAAMWQRATGERIDGAIAIDPTTISYLLAVTGPATTSGGERITADNVVPLTQKTLYQRFPDTERRKAFLIDIASGISRRLLAAHASPALIKAAMKGSTQRRLLLWSADPALEAQLRTTSLGGVLDAGQQPFVGFTTVNAAGGKLDYYLHRSLTYQRSCDSGVRSTATFTLKNQVPGGRLPSYVTLRADRPSYRTRPGDNKVLVNYYVTPGSTITGVAVDGRPTVVAPSTEHGLVVFTVAMELPAGSTRVLTVTADEPRRSGAVQVLKQPGVIAESVRMSVQGCG
jgi:Protein of unknown function (DUF4012)